MRSIFILILLIIVGSTAKSQTVAQIKKVLDTTQNPIGFVKYVLKKKYFIDTVSVISTGQFMGKADSIAYHGKVGKVYGPFRKEHILVKVLAKAPNTFYHINHILLDTAVFDSAFAESLADTILNRIRTGSSSFAAQASIYSADLESASKGGDLGWFVQGVMMPQLDKEMVRRKKGEMFKVWSSSGLHVVKVADNPKEDTGYALLLRVIL